MKQQFKRMASAVLSAVIAALSVGSYTVYGEAPESGPATVTVSFDLSEEGVTIEEDGVLEDIVSDANSSVRLPETSLEKEGYFFTGWTIDGVRGYAPGDVLQVSTEDITLTPVWFYTDDEDFHEVNYYVEIDGEVIDDPKTVPHVSNVLKGMMVEVSLTVFNRNDAKQLGWIYDGTVYRGQQKFIMPDHDVTLTPNWLTIYKLTYSVGDVDRVIGAQFMEFEYAETLSTDLQANSRFSRKGFKITGWYCDVDGLTYKPLAKYVMPSSDVVMTAVWEPITYNVVFNPGTGSSDIIRIPGDTDTYITVPECTGTKKGYTFAGWKYGDKIYMPGDEFFIEGADPGTGIAFTANWIEGTEPSTPPATEPSTAPLDVTIWGDANCDDAVNLADAVLIMQYSSNPDKYGHNKPDGITDQGLVNSDVTGNGDGVTNLDALAIQKLMLGLITELPEKA